MDSYGTQGPLETTRDHEPDHSLESSTALSPTKKEKDKLGFQQCQSI